MVGLVNQIKDIENLIEKALWELELHDQLGQALASYQDAEARLASLGLNVNDPAFGEQQRVLSYCLMRQGNILRQMDRSQEALALGEREIASARASGDEITLARSLMSNGTNLIVSGNLDAGLEIIEDARKLFDKGTSRDHRQGLGWYWILQADLASAGLLATEPAEIIEIASRAIEILEPIKNWIGVARSYSVRAKAYDKMGNKEQAEQDSKQQQLYESKVELEENPGE